MAHALKALMIGITYVVSVAAVSAAVLVTSHDTPWVALLVAMAIVHLGFGFVLGRWSTLLLPIVASLAAVVADIDGFSITTLLVGVPCTMLVFSGTCLRIGWDGGGPRISRLERRELQRERRRLRDEERAVEYDEGGFSYEDPGTWPDAPYPA